MSSNDGLILRDATVEDAAVIAAIYNESIAAGDASLDEGEKSIAEIRGWIDGFGPRETILVLEAPGGAGEIVSGDGIGCDGEDGRGGEDGSDKVLGWGIIKRYSDRRGYRFACETSVYLRRHEVGRGLGTRIKQALIQRCREYGYHHLVAKIFAENTRSIDYNLKQGYELVGIQKEIGWKNGRWQDIAILQLLLSASQPSDP